MGSGVSERGWRGRAEEVRVVMGMMRVMRVTGV